MSGYDKSLLKSLYLNIDGVGKFSISTLTTMSNILGLIGKEDMEIDVRIYTQVADVSNLSAGHWCYTVDGEIEYM